jgi:hypothetical protein
MPLLVILTLLGSVWVAKAAGLWQTSGRGQILLDASGQPDPASIKGWMTLADVSETYGIPVDDLYTMIGAESSVPPTTAIKELEKLVPGMAVWTVREGVAAYLAGSWTPDMGRFGAAGIAPAGSAPVERHPTPAPEPTPTPALAVPHVPRGQNEGLGEGIGAGYGFGLPQDGSRLPGVEIKGRMTLQEVVDHCQVPLDHLITALELPTDVDLQMRMRDLANRFGIELGTIRDAVTRYQQQN